MNGSLLTFGAALARIVEAEGAVGDGDVEPLVGKPHGRAIVLRVDHRPALEEEAGRRACEFREAQGYRAELRLLRVARLDHEALRIVSHDFCDAAEIRIRAGQDAEGRIADRIAIHA